MAASAYFCGSSTQTIRSASWTSRSTSRWWATSVESWSGRSSSTSPSSASSSRPAVEHRVAHDLVPRRDAEPLEELVGAVGPQAQAVAHDVVGRRTPTAASSSPVSGVERRGLAGAGGAGEGDDGVVGRRAGAGRRRARRPRRPRRRSGVVEAAAGRPTACVEASMRAPMSVLRRPASWPPRARTSWSPSRSGRSVRPSLPVASAVHERHSGPASRNRRSSTRRDAPAASRRDRVDPEPVEHRRGTARSSSIST